MRAPILTSVLLFLAVPCVAAPKPANRARPARPASPAARAASTSGAVASLRVTPSPLLLAGRGAEQSLLVTGVTADGREVDLTRAATYHSTNAAVVRVEPGGLARLAGDGTALVEARVGGRTVRVPARARGSRSEPPLSFRNDVMPLLGRVGCYQAACHAKAGGQNGFQLSVLQFDPEADYAAITRQAGGRRVDRQDPGRSLLLLKATLTVPHAGGQRFRAGSPEYRLLARWIAEGASYGPAGEPSLARIEVEPRERVLAPKAQQQLLATAVYSDGSRRDVTRLAEYRSNETGIAGVDESGRMQATDLAGEAAVMVRYMGQVAVSRVTVPLKQAVAREAYAGLPRQNYIDDLVYRKLAQLNLLPSEPCDDATFLRRASLDLIGTLPTAEETRRFLAECEKERHAREGMGVWVDGCVGVEKPVPAAGSLKPPTAKAPSGPVKQDLLPPQATPTHPHTHTPTPSGKNIPALKTRAALVNELLDRPEYADYWAMRWTNLLLVDRDPLFPKGAFAYDRWLRDAFRSNMPFDRFAREIVAASGETYRNGPANFYRALATPVEHAKSLSQLFLGVRIDCAQCHHHPSERWGQDDFYAMSAFFARVKRKGSAEFEQIVYAGPEGEVTQPRTGQTMAPKPLGGPAPQIPEGEDRREYLARWMTAPENPFFARTLVNRVWGLMLGRGLVEPVDDFRVSNPATNEPLLDALAQDFVQHGYDVKHLLRTIALSAAYARGSKATPNNARDTRNYSRFYVKRLPAEVLLDAVSQVTGVPETYAGHPAGTRAIQMWDNKLPVEFLNVFGRPSRLSVCECDRPTDGSVTQVLHLMNGPSVQNRLTAEGGLVSSLEKSGKSPEQIVEELYLTAYNRPPQESELAAARKAFERPGGTRRAAIEDVFWALLNSPEFLFNH